MAQSKNASTRKPVARPGRTLLLFLAAVVALYGVLVAIDLNRDKGDDSAWKPRLGLDLQGGTRITLQAESTDGKVTTDKLAEARGIIDQRVNATGVSEAEVTTQGGNQVVIEIPGERRGNIVDQVGKTAQLRFRLVWAGGQQSAQQPLSDAEAKKAADTIARTDWSKLSLAQMIAAETQSPSTLPKEYQAGLQALQKQVSGFQCTRTGSQIDDVAKLPLVTCDRKSGEVYILSPSVIEGSQVKKAAPVFDNQRSQWVVSISMRDQGSKAFDQVTTALVAQQKQFAIVLDGDVISAPTSQQRIRNGESQISGSFTSASSKALADQLKYGALPLTFKVNGVSVEGPSLAGTQLEAGLLAGAAGLVLVIIYLLLYYRGLGLVAIGSLLVAAAITYALVLLLGKGMGFTLTLPGIAGLIVAIGITADSFIVYFERLRDEVRDGKSLRLAVEAGWKRARSTILAADAVSFLAALILFIFAIGVVRGFAFALGLTTLIDVLVVFGFTKPLVTVLARTTFFGQGHKLSGLDSEHLGIGSRRVDRTAGAPSSRRTRGGEA